LARELIDAEADMMICEQCGKRRLRSWIVERAQGRLLIIECASCGKRTTRWFGDPPGHQNPPPSPEETGRKPIP
jgi:hypothetical protein